MPPTQAGRIMGNDPVARVLLHKGIEPTSPFNPAPNPTSAEAIANIKPDDPHDIFHGEDFGQPATGDGA